jgi:hypothetical protein
VFDGTIDKGVTMAGEPVEADEIPAEEDGDHQQSLMERLERFGARLERAHAARA